MKLEAMKLEAIKRINLIKDKRIMSSNVILKDIAVKHLKTDGQPIKKLVD